MNLNHEEKINEIYYQVVEELSIITPLDIHPKKIYEEVDTYYYVGKLTPISEKLENKKR